MAAKEFGAAVRQFQRLIDVGTTIGLTDDELLARFVAHRDDTSFETLVERHGPMVVSVCRGMLSDPNDAHDAFQATFLVLVRKSQSIRKGVSLGSWLYRVAYNMAIQIDSEAARRKRLERRAAEMPNPIETDDAPGADLVPALYEEVNRLPEKYRLPVVLCHLEEMTHSQAARQLGWTEGMVRGRVAKAREVLRRRLLRRGLALSAGGLASALAERSASAASFAVPPFWLDGTVKAALAIAAGQTAAAGAVSASAFVLSERMVRSMAMTKLKLTAAAMLCAGGAACVGAALVAAGPQNGATRKDPAPAAPRAAAARAAPGAVPSADEKIRPVPVAGRVVDPDGRPVAGAKLYVTEEPEPDRVSPSPMLRATTDAAGRFSFEVTESELGPSWQSGVKVDHPRVVAIADGFGPGFALEPDPSKAYKIRLARDDVPLEGRILTRDGQPVARARIQVASILWTPEEDLTQWRDALRAGEAGYPARFRLLKSWSSLAISTLMPTATTGSDGRFSLRGIGRERIAGVLIEEPSIRTTIEHVVTRPDQTLRVPDFPPGSITFPMTYYGAQFGHVAEPSRPISGVVRDKDTGKPLVGAVVRGNRLMSEAYHFVQTTTDHEGRYRLTGLESPTKPAPDGAILEEVMALAPEGQPYLSAVQSTIEPLETKTLTRDFALKRGIWIKGRVIDKATGQPHPASVEYYVFKDNPHAAEATNIGQSQLPRRHYRTTAEGTFRLVGLPGRGLLGARAGNEAYRMGVGGERIKETRMTIGIETISLVSETIFVSNFHVLSEINPPDGVEEATFELGLDRGDTVKGRVLDPEGRPLAGARPRGLTDWWDSWGASLPAADFEVVGLAPGDVRQVTFLHGQRRLAGSVILRGNVQGPIEVKLEPWGTVTGRLVDSAGQPRAGVELGSPENQKRRVEAGPGSLPEHVKTDADGRFRAEGLAPGLKYNLHILGNGGFYGAVFKDLTIKAGETRDLGDVKKLDD